MSELAVPKTIQWIGGPDGHVELIDQTLLPETLKVLTCRDAEAVREAIVSLRIRGAPAIGVAAAMGQVLGVQGDFGDDRAAFDRAFAKTRKLLAGGRPSSGRWTGWSPATANTPTNPWNALGKPFGAKLWPFETKMPACAGRSASTAISWCRTELAC